MRTLLVWGLGIPVTLALFVIVLFSLLIDRSGSSIHSIGRLWSQILLFLSGAKVDIEGIAEASPGPGVFVSNHQSAFDILVLQANLPGTFRWVAKESLFSIPLVGWSMSLAGYIRINRGSGSQAYRSLLKAAAVLKTMQDSVVIFPEGTRNVKEGLLPFKRGSFILAIKSGMPVIPVVISGTRHIMSKGSPFIRPASVHVEIGEPVLSTGMSEGDLMKRVREIMEDSLRRLEVTGKNI